VSAIVASDRPVRYRRAQGQQYWPQGCLHACAKAACGARAARARSPISAVM